MHNVLFHSVSSSGYERNLSTFALVHTKIIREESGYEQKDKIIYPCAMMLDATTFDIIITSIY